MSRVVYTLTNDAQESVPVNYVHVNPLKHGYVKRVADWPYSTFHHYVAQSIYLSNWCGDMDISVSGGE